MSGESERETKLIGWVMSIISYGIHCEEYVPRLTTTFCKIAA